MSVDKYEVTNFASIVSNVVHVSGIVGTRQPNGQESRVNSWLGLEPLREFVVEYLPVVGSVVVLSICHEDHSCIVQVDFCLVLSHNIFDPLERLVEVRTSSCFQIVYSLIKLLLALDMDVGAVRVVDAHVELLIGLFASVVESLTNLSTPCLESSHGGSRH